MNNELKSKGEEVTIEELKSIASFHKGELNHYFWARQAEYGSILQASQWRVTGCSCI